MMIRGAPSCYPNGPVYGDSAHEVISSSVDEHSNPTSFLYNLSVLKHKFNEIQSLSSIFLSSDHGPHPESTAIATMGTLIQEIIVTASSMMFACQQMSLSSSPANYNAAAGGDPPVVVDRGPSYLFSANHHDNWFGDSYNNCSSSNDQNYNHSTGKNNGVDSCTQGVCKKELPQKTEIDDVVELDAADILAKYTHYCQICSKGFKRDANLRMHMRAHGEEYKSSAALSNPMRDMKGERRKYSCPQDGCRWNKHHAKFQPLKSMICVKNHYKRSHCPKMYVCKRCSRKQFSVLSDLRTHEKHCGDAKWLCSCGTTFSRKDKLMGHVALFAGHTPAVNLSMKIGSGAQNLAQMHVDE